MLTREMLFHVGTWRAIVWEMYSIATLTRKNVQTQLINSHHFLVLKDTWDLCVKPAILRVNTGGRPTPILRNLPVASVQELRIMDLSWLP